MVKSILESTANAVIDVMDVLVNRSIKNDEFDEIVSRRISLKSNGVPKVRKVLTQLGVSINKDSSHRTVYSLKTSMTSNLYSLKRVELMLIQLNSEKDKSKVDPSLSTNTKIIDSRLYLDDEVYGLDRSSFKIVRSRIVGITGTSKDPSYQLEHCLHPFKKEDISRSLENLKSKILEGIEIKELI